MTTPKVGRRAGCVKYVIASYPVLRMAYNPWGTMETVPDTPTEYAVAIYRGDLFLPLFSGAIMPFPVHRYGVPGTLFRFFHRVCRVKTSQPS